MLVVQALVLRWLVYHTVPLRSCQLLVLFSRLRCSCSANHTLHRFAHSQSALDFGPA